MNRTHFYALASLGGWTFYEVTGHGFTGDLADKPMYAFTTVPAREAEPKVGEYYDMIEHAMASAIAAKYTGPRGAGGSGVGTAADWFMRSIGAFEPTRAELIEKARGVPGGTETAGAVLDALNLGRRP